MKHTLSRRALCISTAILSLAVTVPGLSGLALAADGTIKLGIVAPMSGPNARYGAFSMRGAELAVKEINDAGGVDGQKIELYSADSQGTPVEGVSATRRLIDEDEVDYVIGDVSSSVTLAMQPVAEDAEVLLLNAASSNPKITYAAGVGGFKWTYRNYPTDENRAFVVAKYAAEQRGFTKFAVLSVDSDYGRSAIEFTKNSPRTTTRRARSTSAACSQRSAIPVRRRFSCTVWRTPRRSLRARWSNSVSLAK
ncbi:ABC-type branched-subunit amino acid transport system substrate-binding protein [Sinorhizobium fredii]